MHVYRLIMQDSTDVLLNVISFTKLQLYEAFTRSSDSTSKTVYVACILT